MSEQFINEVFDLCVNILIFYAEILGISYNEINVWLFVIIQPLIHLIMIVWIIYLLREIRKLKLQLG